MPPQRSFVLEKKASIRVNITHSAGKRKKYFFTLCKGFTILREKKDWGCTFYHDTLRTKRSPLGICMERYGLMAVVPTLTALLLSSLNDLQFFFVFLYALLEFSCAKHYR